MSAWTKIKLAAVGVVGVGAAGAAGYVYMTGEADLHVLAPQNTGITVRVGDKDVATVKAGAHTKFSIAQGEYSIELANDDGDTHTVKVNVDSGFYEALVPSTAEQCFADLDVYETFYGKANPPPMPELAGTHGSDKAMDVSSNHYYSDAALPNEVKEGSTINLVQEIPCDLVGKDVDIINEAVGFTPDNIKRY